jgi:hypothetical protein
MNKFKDLPEIQRTAAMAAALLLVAVLGTVGFKFVFNPMAPRLDQLEEQLAEIKPVEVKYGKPNWDFEQWQLSLANKPGLWKILVEPPPPPPAPPPPPPDMSKLLTGISASRAQVGGKVRIIKPDSPRGEFMAVGEKINNCAIKEITKTDVIFSITHLGKELTYKMPRR